MQAHEKTDGKMAIRIRPSQQENFVYSSSYSVWFV